MMIFHICEHVLDLKTCFNPRILFKSCDICIKIMNNYKTCEHFVEPMNIFSDICEEVLNQEHYLNS